MPSRKSLPSRIESRRKSALERRSKDLVKHIAAKDLDKISKAKSDLKGLKKHLGIS
jgi:uncharacterized C2H2 Zn-finger protein